MEWPARSPDLNPIEHLWDYLGREVAALNSPPRSLHELKQGLLCVWSSLPIPVSDNLINSMGNRCRQCIQLDVSEELGIAQSIIYRLWQLFQDDGIVSRCYSTGRPRVTMPNEAAGIWQLLPKETDGAQHQTCLVSPLQLPVRQFQGRPCTDA
ncbi:uncharacterized protein TNCV_1774712 [Trichonephila clavipes]|nr:uncharacterized protein TNCV_1774712 [Trichonephila clavipes]